MKNKVITVVHGSYSNTGRIGKGVQAKGFEEVRCCLPTGDTLPDCFDDIAGAVVFGGPMSANDDDTLDFIAKELVWIDKVMEQGVPFLGICLGAQMLARTMGATVKPHDGGWHEIGFNQVVPTDAGEELLGDMGFFYQWHGEGFDLPSGCDLLATSATGYFPHQMFQAAPQAYGVQFHPECSLDIIKLWMTEAAHRLEERGAQQPEEQLANAEKYDHLVDAWVPGFLDRWLGESPARENVRDAAE